MKTMLDAILAQTSPYTGANMSRHPKHKAGCNCPHCRENEYEWEERASECECECETCRSRRAADQEGEFEWWNNSQSSTSNPSSALSQKFGNYAPVAQQVLDKFKTGSISDGWKAVAFARSIAPQYDEQTVVTKIVQPLLRTPQISLNPFLSNTPTGNIQSRIDPKRNVWKESFWLKNKSKERKLTDITGVVLHQMAIDRGNFVDKYLKVGSHYIVLADGQIAQLYDDRDFLNASNCFNNKTVAIEFAGNFPNAKYHWWSGNKAFNYLTPAQANAGRFLLKTLKSKLPSMNAVFAHRQANGSGRENDPEIGRAHV